MDYNPGEIEKKWKAFWDHNEIYKVPNNSDKPKYYVLDMFPYPSGSGLHVGHPLGYIASDIYARYKRLKGFNVLHPMGFDAFGLPAEQYALDTGNHPSGFTDKNIKYFREQLDSLGFCYDWSREVRTCDPKYYKWTQWIFLQLFEHYYDNNLSKAQPITKLVGRFEEKGNVNFQAATSQEETFSATEWNAKSLREKDDILMNYRLAYRKVSYVNWCEALGTVLANDEVKDGLSERGGHPVIQKPMLQWSLRTTAYAQRLLDGLDTVDWSDALKAQQRNWIGRSEGAQLFFDIELSSHKIEVFTTRPDTIFGATFMVLAPEHPLVKKITTAHQYDDIEDYLKYVNARSERDRMEEAKKVTGAFTGAYAINPFTNEKIPVWIGEYVLKDYGTGAIMAVPADDERDKRFAEKFDLKIIDIIDKSMHEGAGMEDKVGKMINSGFLNGMEVKEAIQKVIDQIEEKGIGKRRINYKLRDANYSRQRYWGEPVPVQYDADGVAYADYNLPLELPDLENFKPTAEGKSPLSRLDGWVYTPDGLIRETDTMPGYAGSSWYFLRYMDPENEDAFAGKEALNYWKDVDLYIGGTEHAVGHLLYSRMWHKFLHDIGKVPTDEPFRKLINQGMIQGIIEYIYLKKEKTNGQYHFLCSKKVEMMGLKEEDYQRLPVKIQYIKAYGSPDSFLDIESIKQFLDWRPEYANAIFECGKGVYQNGEFNPTDGAKDSHLFTRSETGKMGKRYFNTVDPVDVIGTYGTDCFRLYEMFLGPITDAKPWNTKGIEGTSRFLKKFWGLFFNNEGEFSVNEADPTKEELKIMHKTIKRVGEDIERFSFNTCVSALMEATNDLRKLKSNNKTVLRSLVVLIAPFAPHMAEELWHRLWEKGSVNDATFPEFDEKHLKEDSITYPISINGKKRAVHDFPSDAPKEDLEKAAVELEDIQKWIEGKTIRKVIVVPGRMINIVVG